MNKVVLIGRLTADPELRFTPGNGTAVSRIILAVQRRYKKEGQEEADFVPVVIWGKQAEAIATHQKKGRLIAVSGRIQTRNYEAKDGIKRYVTEVIAEETKFLEWGKKEENIDSQNDFGDEIVPVDDADIPF
ncbi:single-stranded DNA-binding protein [Clostridium sporogenes]|uniref:single-stranded DNA-binding protein n=1 Tax=Clostridium sporogenes TaxID=1509 RepID=UPI0013D058A8|nr:single-stranded DNA-binding protein [Clostridium sporogenes]NFH34433.1 single-stranded DNA-binding protein [Clostridium sporogenes]NFL21800.1 single-stranded DNA-binding protein [Clostridium sporogenes]NFN74067.1 single-stranded DNA-binding protein [Clostridium sporogenes]NFV23487.1 single-stranded DNA-binding protein [Clostridium sporogenes]